MKHRILLCAAAAAYSISLCACASNTCVDPLKWTLDKNGTLTITGKGEMENCDNGYIPPWFTKASEIKNVVIEEGITSIGNQAFSGYNALTSVTIPASVSSIGTGAFSCCPVLTDLTVSADNPNFIFTDGVLFSKDQTQLLCYPDGKQDTEYVIPDSVTVIGDSAFSNCKALTSVTIPDSVTDIGKSAFWYCTGLTDITIPKSVTRLQEDTFNGCSGLSDSIFTIPENVTSIGVGALCCSNGHVCAVTILNPDCSIETSDEAVTIASDVIYGYEGSTAERFAKKYNKFFEAIEKTE